MSPSTSTLQHPRILCLHGGGTTSEIFRIQCRGIIAAFEPYFRCVFADAPFPSGPGPGILPFFSGMGPYRRWVRSSSQDPEIDDEQAVQEIEDQLRSVMEQDDSQGATGEWVGLLGFSQGAKMSASILYDIQLRREGALGTGNGVGTEGENNHPDLKGFAGGRWQFALLMAGGGPLVSLSEASAGDERMVMAGQIADPTRWVGMEGDSLLNLPTIHVHGLKDWGLEKHRAMLHTFCDPKGVTLIEWDGDHRLPIKPADVGKVLDATLLAATQLGILGESGMMDDVAGTNPLQL